MTISAVVRPGSAEIRDSRQTDPIETIEVRPGESLRRALESRGWQIDGNASPTGRGWRSLAVHALPNAYGRLRKLPQRRPA